MRYFSGFKAYYAYWLRLYNPAIINMAYKWLRLSSVFYLIPVMVFVLCVMIGGMFTGSSGFMSLPYFALKYY